MNKRLAMWLGLAACTNDNAGVFSLFIAGMMTIYETDLRSQVPNYRSPVSDIFARAEKT